MIDRSETAFIGAVKKKPFRKDYIFQKFLYINLKEAFHALKQLWLAKSRLESRCCYKTP
jgi:hypothetical protein